MTSTDIINEAKSKYENLASYGFDWLSFYNGYVEGRIACLPFIKEIVTVETPESKATIRKQNENTIQSHPST